MSYALRMAARRVVDSLRARAKIATRDGHDHLAVFLTLEANRLEAPLLVDEEADRREMEELQTRRLHTERGQ